jgi:GNAT superfamily N-acetyltransferase
MVPIIRTARLELVSFSVSAMRATLDGDLASVAAELGAGVPEDLGGVLGGLFELRIAQLEADPGGLPWLARAIVVTDDAGIRRLVGSIGFHHPPIDGVVEIGYNVEPAFRRRGIATEAVRAMLDWAADQGVHSIRASVAATNLASRGVIAQFGFEQSGTEYDDDGSEELVFMTTWPPVIEARSRVARPHVA